MNLSRWKLIIWRDFISILSFNFINLNILYWGFFRGDWTFETYWFLFLLTIIALIWGWIFFNYHRYAEQKSMLLLLYFYCLFLKAFLSCLNLFFLETHCIFLFRLFNNRWKHYWAGFPRPAWGLPRAATFRITLLALLALTLADLIFDIFLYHINILIIVFVRINIVYIFNFRLVIFRGPSTNLTEWTTLLVDCCPKTMVSNRCIIIAIWIVILWQCLRCCSSITEKRFDIFDSKIIRWLSKEGGSLKGVRCQCILSSLFRITWIFDCILNVFPWMLTIYTWILSIKLGLFIDWPWFLTLCYTKSSDRIVTRYIILIIWRDHSYASVSTPRFSYSSIVT